MSENLILSETMYYHPLLIEERLPVMISFSETNEVSMIDDKVEPLRIKSSFTMDDLYAHWVKISGAPSFNEKRDINALLKLNEGVGLDLLLFSMDLAERAKKEGRFTASPYRLEDFMLEASGTLTRRVNAFRKAGYFN